MGSLFTVYYYVSATGDNPIKSFLDSLSERQQAKILRIFQFIETYGLQAIISHVRKLSGTPLWEIRILGKDNIRTILLLLDFAISINPSRLI